MAGFTKTMVTFAAAAMGGLGSGVAFAHGAHAPAEGILHVVAHFVESMDQPLVLGGVAGLILVALMAGRYLKNHRE